MKNKANRQDDNSFGALLDCVCRQSAVLTAAATLLHREVDVW